jgi:hypothetical protein
MVCRRADRAFDDIGVAHRPLPDNEDRFPELRVNVTFCVDNPPCVAYAHLNGPWTGPPAVAR